MIAAIAPCRRIGTACARSDLAFASRRLPKSGASVDILRVAIDIPFPCDGQAIVVCGIAGAWSFRSCESGEALQTLGRRMAARIAHRGPDDAGVWIDAAAGLVLAHRRLSILDLSSAGHQPMVSCDRRWTLVFNGEIYNHAELRSELVARGYPFRGHSDTEVLLAAIVHWGFVATLGRSNGMFAIAVWDSHTRELWLARDRVGKKPLYYGWTTDGTFVFGSELRALLAHPALNDQVDPDALALLLRLDYIPAPYSILRSVRKLQAGGLIRLREADRFDNFTESTATDFWWRGRDRHLASIHRRFDGDEAEALDEFDRLLRDATALRKLADVPLGAFLSGGTDSSLVVAAMQAQSATAVRTFAIGFDNVGHDETAYASAVARHLGTDHAELRVDGHAALDLVPELPSIFDEPFADSSQLPTALLCRLARRDVKVALTGDGGDELFFGYHRYTRALRNDGRLSRLPRRLLARISGEAGEQARLGGLAALRAELGAVDIQGVARRRIERWRRPEAVVLGARRRTTAYDDPAAIDGALHPAEALMRMDFDCYLPEDVLTKVDRASMAASLEVRCPLLDWRVVEFAWSLPLDMKYRDGHLKHLPKRLLSRYLSEDLVYRNKSGFGAPVGDWLRGPLRDWAEHQLDARRLAEEGYFSPAPIRDIWQAFCRGERKWHTHLWNILMFQSWRESLLRDPAMPTHAGSSANLGITEYSH